MPSSILNSDDGVISGTSGLKSSGGDDGVLVFQSKGTETARINTDKQIEAAAGTVSLPSITTTGDVNTGIFFPAADTIAFSEGGVERMRIDSSGQLMLGTATSTNTLSVDIQNKSASSNNVFVQIKNTTNNEDVGLIIICANKPVWHWSWSQYFTFFWNRHHLPCIGICILRRKHAR
jgi:hypothetical protein